MIPTTPSGSWEGDVDTAGDGDLIAEVAFDPAGEVVEHVADVRGFPTGVADRVPRLGDLESGEVVDVSVDGTGAAARQFGPFRYRVARHFANASARPMASFVDSTECPATSVMVVSVAGLRTAVMVGPPRSGRWSFGCGRGHWRQ